MTESAFFMLIVTNFAGFPARWQAANGREGTTRIVDSFEEFATHASNPDAILLVNCQPAWTIRLGAARRFARKPAPIVAVDLILRRPASARQSLAAFAKRQAFAGVDLFIHYFRDVSGLDECYGIDAARSIYVPFKSNLWHLRPPEPLWDGEYAFCFGRSLRDFETFFSAMERLPHIPGAIVEPHKAEIWEHGSRFTRSLNALPKNVRVLSHDLTPQSQYDVLAQAKLVVLPILRSSIVSAGISTALNAMLTGKCVIGTEGPGFSDIFTEEVLLAPPEDPAALAAVIERAWTDGELRRKTALAGFRHANANGSLDDFYARIINAVGAWAASRL